MKKAASVGGFGWGGYLAGRSAFFFSFRHSRTSQRVFQRWSSFDSQCRLSTTSLPPPQSGTLWSASCVGQGPLVLPVEGQG